MLPRIVSPRRQSGAASSIPAGSGATAISRIHPQLSSFIAARLYTRRDASTAGKAPQSSQSSPGIFLDLQSLRSLRSLSAIMAPMLKSFIVIALFLSSAAAQAQAQTPAAPPPADVKPGSINCEECPYPYPSSYLPLTLYGQDVRIAYMDVAPSAASNGHTVVLLHGTNFAGVYFGGPSDVLRKEGFRVVVPDQIGYGRSSKPIIPYNFHDMARNTRAILQHLNIPRVMVVGHSMGGMLATRFATQYPDMVERLVLYNPIGLTDP